MSPRNPLIHSLTNQSQSTPPNITTHPYHPTAKSDEVPQQVQIVLNHVSSSVLSLSDVFPVDMLMITLVHFRPPAFLLFTTLSFDTFFMMHRTIFPRADRSCRLVFHVLSCPPDPRSLYSIFPGGEGTWKQVRTCQEH